jgi:excisionase family DNA binding protein
MASIESALWLGKAKDRRVKMSEIDSGAWVGKEEAAKLLKVSVRQIERRAHQGAIERKHLPKAANEKSARVVFSRADIEALLRGEEPAAEDLGMTRAEILEGVTELTKREVIEYLGKSKRTVETMIAQGRLPAQYFNGPNGKQAAFARADVERLKGEIETPMVRPAARLEAAVETAKSLAPLAEAIAAALRTALQADVPKPRAWLTLDEAVEYSGLPKSYLLALARGGGDATHRKPDFAVNVGTGTKEFWRFNREALSR